MPPIECYAAFGTGYGYGYGYGFDSDWRRGIHMSPDARFEMGRIT